MTAYHPDDVRRGLEEAATRRAEADRERAAAMLDIGEWALRAQPAGVQLVEVAEITGLSRPTIYALMRDRG